MNIDHPLLTTIRAGIETTGTHSHHWGQLRREVFAGLDAWLGLKGWCAQHAFECELAFNESSKSAHVQFRRQRRNAA